MWKWFIVILVSPDWHLQYDRTELIRARSIEEACKKAPGMVGSIVDCGPDKPEIVYKTEYQPGDGSRWFTDKSRSSCGG